MPGIYVTLVTRPQEMKTKATIIATNKYKNKNNVNFSCTNRIVTEKQYTGL